MSRAGTSTRFESGGAKGGAVTFRSDIATRVTRVRACRVPGASGGGATAAPTKPDCPEKFFFKRELRVAARPRISKSSGEVR